MQSTLEISAQVGPGGKETTKHVLHGTLAALLSQRMAEACSGGGWRFSGKKNSGGLPYRFLFLCCLSMQLYHL